MPHGHALVLPRSKHPGTVKSRENQKFMAEDMALARAGSPAYFSAPLRPPCQAAVMVTALGQELRTNMSEFFKVRTDAGPMRTGRPVGALCRTTRRIVYLGSRPASVRT